MLPLLSLLLRQLPTRPTHLLLKKQHLLPKKPLVLAVFGFLASLLWVGPLLDCSSVFLSLSKISLSGALAIFASGFPTNLSQGLSTFLTMLLFSKPLLEKLDRIKLKYGMTEADNGL